MGLKLCKIFLVFFKAYLKTYMYILANDLESITFRTLIFFVSCYTLNRLSSITENANSYLRFVPATLQNKHNMYLKTHLEKLSVE